MPASIPLQITTERKFLICGLFFILGVHKLFLFKIPNSFESIFADKKKILYRQKGPLRGLTQLS